jgi:Respiratory-chain NADH dehydrogenase, 30 Kd subunit
MPTAPVGFENTLKQIYLSEDWRWDKGAWWLEPAEPIDIRAITECMRKLDARFIAITAMELPNKEIRLDYQWDLDGQLLSFVTTTRNREMPTIVDLAPAADWVERETHEYFVVEFKGRASTLPLMTRAGDAIGINLRKEAVQ